MYVVKSLSVQNAVLIGFTVLECVTSPMERLRKDGFAEAAAVVFQREDPYKKSLSSH